VTEAVQNPRCQSSVKPGSELILSADELGIHLQTFDQAVRAAQEMMAPYRVAGRSIVDELIADRRAEARRESRKRPAGD
jgi:hypothetical protein